MHIISVNLLVKPEIYHERISFVTKKGVLFEKSFKICILGFAVRCHIARIDGEGACKCAFYVFNEFVLIIQFQINYYFKLNFSRLIHFYNELKNKTKIDERMKAIKNEKNYVHYLCFVG